MEETIRNADRKDIERLESFLVEANLDANGLEDCIEYYSLLETKQGKLKACIGIEPIDNVGLLRSFVVSPTTTKVQVLLLFDRVIRIAESKQLSSLYLVTNKETALPFFNKIGFMKVDNFPECLHQNLHFKQVLNVDNAFIMEMTVKTVDNS
ncbi:hypothetical protein [Bacillus sp. B15-48]|uniref:GNAT family N-acetyltransferase n=1 Tax=Bacillus sp. B15-48 TaxID=1548601 RepID=UPI00193F2756|nr:hypothetical protein [Bacillus sp. B15-48]MBM4761546.1 hypothetical protein [Bacillus sp. B15-48]